MSNENTIYESLLNLPTLCVDSVELSERKALISCHTDSRLGECPVCKKSTGNVNQYTTHLIRDLDLAGRQVTLKVKVRQYSCTDCGRYFTEKLSFSDLGTNYTHRLAKFIFDLNCQ